MARKLKKLIPMFDRRWAVFLLLSTLIVVGSLQASPAEVVPANYLPLVLKSTSEVSQEELQVELFIQQKINEIRLAHGLPELNLVVELTQAARGHSRDMADNNFTGHTGSDGSTPGERIAAAGYQAWTWSEIIGWGFGGDPAAMIDWWMNSDIHRAMILSSTFEDFGVGYRLDPASTWGHYWTVDFGARTSNDDPLLFQDYHECTARLESQLGGSSQLLAPVLNCHS